MNNSIKKYKAEIVCSIAFLFIGMFIGYISNSNSHDWYVHLAKPSFTPPSYLFPIAWSILYLMLGIIFFKIWKIRKANKFFLPLFILQFIINLSWTPIFFYAQKINLALYNIILFWSILIVLIYIIRKEKIIFILFIPYFLWVSFALVLNYYICLLN